MKGRYFFIALIMCMFLTVIMIGGSNWVQKGEWSYVNIAPQAVATAYHTLPGRAPQDGGSPACINDRDDTGMNGYWMGDDVSKGKFNWVQLEWPEEKKIERVVITSRKKRFDFHPVSYELQAWDGEVFQTKVKVEGNDAEVVTYDFEEDHGVTTDRLRLYITEVRNSMNYAMVNEIYAYQKLPAWQAFFKYTLKEVLSFIFYPLIILIILFLPGYIFLERISNPFNSEEKFVLSFALTIFLFFMVSILCLVAKIPSGTSYILVPLLAYSLYVFIKKRVYLELKFTDKSLILVFMLALYFMIFFQLLFGGLIFQADYFMNYNVSQIFFKGVSIKSPEALLACWGNHLTDRTILHGIIPIPFYYFFGNRFFIYQMFTIILTALFFLSLFLLACRLFGRKIAKITAWFLLLNPYYIYYSIAVPTIMFMTYFVLLYFYFLIISRLKNKYLVAGLISGLAFMVHAASLPYIVGGWLYILTKERFAKMTARKIGSLILPLVGVFTLWTLWSLLYDRVSKFFLAPFASQTGPPGRDHLVFWQLRELILSLFSKKFLMNKVQTFLGYFIYDPREGINFSLRLSTFIHTLPGAVMLSLFLFSVWGFIKGYRKFKWELIYFILLPLLAYAFVIGWYERNAITFMHPIPIFVVVLAIYALWRIHNKGLLFAVYNLCLLEHFYVIWFLYRDGRLVLSKALGGDLLFLIGAVSLLVWYVLNEFLVWGYAKDMEKAPLALGNDQEK